MKHLKNISKQNKRKILITIATVLVCLFNRPFKVSASSGTYYLIDIGSYGQLGQYQMDSSGTGRAFAYTVTISLKAKYNGTITITTNNNISNQDRIATYNCEMDNATNTSYTLRIYNSSYCSFVYESDTAKMFTPSSQSLTKVADIDYYPELGSINTKLTNIYNSIDGVEGYIDNVETYINTLNSTTNTISTNVSDIETTLNDISNTNTSMDTTLNDISVDVNGIETDVGHIRNLITTQNIGITSIVGDTHSILSELNSVLTTLNSSATDISNGVADLSTINGTLSGMSQNLANLYARVNEINQNVENIAYFLNNSVLPALNNITTAVNSVVTAINNVDNLIDAVTWNSYTVSNKVISSDFDGNNTISAGYYGNANTPIYYRFNLNVVNNNGSSIIRITTQARNGGVLEKGFTAKLYYNNNSTLICKDVYINTNYRGTVIYFDTSFLDVTTSTTYILEIRPITVNPPTSNQKIYLNGNNFTVQYIKDTDIEYWELLTSFYQLRHYEYEKQHDETVESKLNDIITAINGININNNISNTEITNTTNNFDNDIETIHNVENNYKLDYDSWNNRINPSDITLDLTSYNDTVNLYKSNITSLWSSDLVSVPITLSILVFIFLVILG